MRSLRSGLGLWALCLLVAPCVAAQDGYEIGSGDILSVTVLAQPSFSGEFTVDGQGLIAYPFLGRVKASGNTVVELERKLVTLMSEGYLKKPQVAVAIKAFRSQRVHVTGEVKSPGPYGLRGERSLMTLLQDIGELLPTVGHEIIVVRAPPPVVAPPVATTTPDGWVADAPAAQASPAPAPALMDRPGGLYPGEVAGSQIFRINLRELRSGYVDRDLQLQVGDTVFFPKAAQVFVSGHVAKPGVYLYEEGLTVYRLLAMAGSVSERGSGKGARIIRLVDGKRKEFKPKPTDMLQPDDTLHVPERFF